MRAMILAAGKGTRLAPLTNTTPKPLLPLAGKPLIVWQLEALAAAGVQQVVINLHHLGEQISTALGDGSPFGVEISYSVEAQLLETGGGIVNALPLLGDQPFWLLNGDIWTDFDFNHLPRTLADNQPAHIVLTNKPANRIHGDFTYANGRVTGRGGDYVYCGIAVIHPDLFKDQATTHFSFRDTLFALIESGQLSAQVHAGRWHDIGTPDAYHQLQASL
ncbi:MAG: NDP-sugar synthase [bacterium]